MATAALWCLYSTSSQSGLELAVNMRGVVYRRDWASQLG